MFRVDNLSLVGHLGAFAGGVDGKNFLSSAPCSEDRCLLHNPSVEKNPWYKSSIRLRELPVHKYKSRRSGGPFKYLSVFAGGVDGKNFLQVLQRLLITSFSQPHFFACSRETEMLQGKKSETAFSTVT